MTTEAALIAEYEAVLEREGLSPLDCPGGLTSNPPGRDARYFLGQEPERAEAVNGYLAWASGVLETYPFDDRPAKGHNGDPARERRIWALYAEGKSVTEIQLELAVNRRSVTKTIERIVSRSPPAPHVNPWLPSIPLRERAELRRQQREEEMDPKKQPRPQLEYSLIRLRRGVIIPGVGNPKEQLVPMKGHAGVVMPLMGTPHAGGIDVEVESFHNLKGRMRVKTRTVITVPWDNIEQANQEPIEVEA